MAQQYQVTVSPRASRQLIAHVEFLSRKSVNAAARLSAEYKAVIQTLKTTRLVSRCLPDGISSISM